MFQDLLTIFLIVLWALVAAYIVIRSWGARGQRVGITIAYVLFFAASHWLPTVVVLIPWYSPLYELDLTLLGFYQSFIAIIGFAIGTLLITHFLQRFHLRLMQRGRVTRDVKVKLTDFSQLPAIYILFGLIFTFVVMPFASTVPTLSAFSSGASNLFQVGLLLLVWQAFQTHSRLKLGIAFTLAVVWPFVGVATSGFLIFAISFVIVFVVFTVSLLEKPARYIIPLTIVAYLGMSLFQTYLSIRHQIRGALWYTDQQVTLETRADVVLELIESFELFDFTNPLHLFAIDVRLNMNHLTGRTMQRIESGAIDYAYGQTVADALLMLVPRMAWPDKPVAVGGQALVRQYAGYGILSGSIAPGQLMEFYLNFGTLGVFFGFVLIGTIVGLLDKYCAAQLRQGNLLRFAMFMVPAFGLLESATTYFVTFVGATTSALITVYIVNIFIFSILLRKHHSSHLHKTWIRSADAS